MLGWYVRVGVLRHAPNLERVSTALRITWCCCLVLAGTGWYPTVQVRSNGHQPSTTYLPIDLPTATVTTHYLPAHSCTQGPGPSLSLFPRAARSFILPFSRFAIMHSMNERLKGLGFGKRKSTPPATPPPPGQPSQPPPSQIPQQPLRAGPTSSVAPSSASVASLSMNHPAGGNRPPSYSANFPQGPSLVGRTSPLHRVAAHTPPTQMVGGPPPINTGLPVSNYAPQLPPVGSGPPMGGPPGYGGQQTGYPAGPSQPSQSGAGPIQQYQRGNPAAEVEGNSRSKAQLIVGIDFVSMPRHARHARHARHLVCLTDTSANRALLSRALLLPLPRVAKPRRTSSLNGLEPDRTRSKRWNTPHHERRRRTMGLPD